MEVARTALRLFGVTLPDANDEAGLAADFGQQMAEYSRLLNQRPMGDLIELADIADREQDGIIRLMAIPVSYTHLDVYKRQLRLNPGRPAVIPIRPSTPRRNCATASWRARSSR